MRRKVIKQGHNTLTITLPSKWVNNQGITPGDELDVSEQEKSLLISANSGGTIPVSTTIDISNLTPPIIWRYISSAYRAGYDEIAVTGIGTDKKSMYSAFSYNTLDYLKDQTKTNVKNITISPMETVSAIVNRLIGMEIIDQKSNYCLVKDMSDVSDKEFENALRRIFILLQTEVLAISDGFKGKMDDLRSIQLVDTNLDRFEDFCFRVLNKKGFSTMRKTSITHSMIFTLELIGDEFKKIAVHMMEDGGKYGPLIKEIYEIVIAQLNRAYKFYYKFNKNLVMDIYRIDDEGREIIAKHYKKLNDDEKEILHHLKKIAIYVLSIAELRIDMEF